MSKSMGEIIQHRLEMLADELSRDSIEWGLVLKAEANAVRQVIDSFPASASDEEIARLVSNWRKQSKRDSDPDISSRTLTECANELATLRRKSALPLSQDDLEALNAGGPHDVSDELEINQPPPLPESVEEIVTQTEKNIEFIVRNTESCEDVHVEVQREIHRACQEAIAAAQPDTGLRETLQTLLDQVDWVKGNCRVNEMVGAVLDKAVIDRAAA